MEYWSTDLRRSPAGPCHHSIPPLPHHSISAMALKSYRPLTPAQRFKSLPAFDEITKWKPAKRLLEPKKKTGGRNVNGRITGERRPEDTNAQDLGLLMAGVSERAA